MLYMVQKFIEKDQPKGCLAFFAPNENIGMHYQCWIHQQSKKNCNWCSIEVLSTINRVCHPISCSKRHSSTLTTLFMGGNPCPIIRLITRLTALATGHIREDLAIGQWGSSQESLLGGWNSIHGCCAEASSAYSCYPAVMNLEKYLSRNLEPITREQCSHSISSYSLKKKKVLEGSSREVPPFNSEEIFLLSQNVLCLIQPR